MDDKMDNAEEWRGKEYAFFAHKKCESFPCHKSIDGNDFNCLFCYCPLYTLCDDCGGGFRYLPDGVKDCSLCTIPHERENYGYIADRLKDIIFVMKGCFEMDKKCVKNGE